MPFVQKLPEWNKPGTEPPASLKNAGWQATQKPPADYFNWLQHTAYMALKELQEKAQHKDDVVTIPEATITQKGITQLSSAVTSTAEDKAATPNAVKKVNDSLNAHTNDGSAHGIGDKSTLRTTQKSTIVGAINELFTSANDGKTAVASAVTAKGVEASPADTFSTLASKIGQISTGKKWASGQVVSVNVGEQVIVSNLPFRPSIILVYSTAAGYTDSVTAVVNGSSTNNAGVTIVVKQGNGSASFNLNANHVIALNDGFKITNVSVSGSVVNSIHWIVFE